MSTGGIVGGVVGAVAGFIYGGPYGAWVGFTLGFGLGSMIDPIKPDVPTPGQPNIGELVVNTAQEGLVVPDVLGTTKLNGNIVWFDNDRTTEITEQQETPGGKGGGGSSSQTVVTGYQYYLTWAMVLCIGPVDKLYTIYANDDVVWSGDLSRPGGGVSTLTLAGMGSVTFYWGTDDHTANSTIAGFLDDTTLNVPYRNQCWMLFNDNTIGDHNRAPTIKVVLGKFPTFGFNSNNTIDIYDYNPAHAIYYITNTMANMPATYLDDTTFSGVAETMNTESRGVSILFDSYQTSETYVESILQHIKGIIRFSNNGKFSLKLIRNDMDTNDMITFNADELLTDDYEYSRKSWVDTVNEVRLQYAQRVITEEEE